MIASDGRVFLIGEKVVKNPDAWIVNDFDSWDRGVGVGTVVEPPFELEGDEIDILWPTGRCFETTDQLIKL